MDLVLLKNPLTISAKTLKTLINTFKDYTKKPVFPSDDEKAYDESQAAADLINEAIYQITLAKDELKTLVAQIKKEYDSIQEPGEKEDFSDALEKLEIDTNFNEILGAASESIFMLRARLTDVISTRNRLGRKLGLNVPAQPNLTVVTNEDFIQNNDEQQDVNENNGWISENSNDSIEANIQINRNDNTEANHTIIQTCNNVKTPALEVPNFYGVEEDFPEFWAVYDTLVHRNPTLTTVAKMLYLKNCLKGKSDNAIKGIQLIPQNYGWMIEALKKKYSNKPINRARIIHRLTLLTPATKTAESCAHVFDRIQMLVNQMVSAGQDIRKTNDAMWTEMILEKFPYDIVKNVLIAIKDKEEVTIEEIMEKIEKEISAKTYVQSRMKAHQKRGETTTETKSPQITITGPLCALCEKGGHYATNCRTITDVQARRNIAIEKQLCWKCYSSKHFSSECQRPNCASCGRQHHISLCFASRQQSSSGTSRPNTNAQKQNSAPFRRAAERPRVNWKSNSPYNLRAKEKTTSRTNLANQSNFGIEKTGVDAQKREQIVLMTAEGMIWNHNTENFEKVLFFFDTGAQKTVIREDLAQKLGLPKLKTETCVMSGLGGHTEMFESNVVSIKVGSAYGKDMETIIHTKPLISKGFPSVKLNNIDKEFLQKKEVCIANTKLRGEMQNPDILVGLDLYYNFILETPESIVTPSGLRVAKTIFGPTVYGRGSTDGKVESTNVSYGMTAIMEEENELLSKLFELEGLGISKNEYARHDEVFDYFESYSKDIIFQNGYITAPFPLKSNIIDLTDNYAVAYRRLVALQNQLCYNSKQKEWYCKILREYEEQNIIEEITYDIANASGVYYMPHSGVWREHKAKPLRIVFDASSKQKRCLSLNDVIHKGESFVTKIHDILVASRTSKIILLCDIEAAFTQIRLKETHKDLCRFLWLKNPDLPLTKSNIVEFRFNRLPFGVTASPSILNMALVTYLNSTTSPFAQEIIKNLYVDNILLHANNPEEALQKYSQGKALLAEIGMNLREFVSNSEFVNEQIPEIDRTPGGNIKFLGVPYNTYTDAFSVKITFPMKENLTKRDIVSQLNSIYDPIGIAAPLIVKLKSLMREIYEFGTDWNQILPKELTNKWNTACNEINNVEVTVARYLGSNYDAPAMRDSDLCDLWVFADASASALAACSYFKNHAGHITALVSGKTRLTPKKTTQTVPRLEILATLMAIRLAKNICESTTVAIRQIHIVSDSEIALSWIKSNRKLPVFVRNQRERIIKLKQDLESCSMFVKFHHVATNYNPADAGTRGVTARQIQAIDWIEGPQWLSKSGPYHQLKDISEIQEFEEEEEPLQILMPNVIENVTDIENNDDLVDITRFSQWNKLIRTVARVGKIIALWVTKTREKRGIQIQLQRVAQFDNDTEITAEDMKLGERILIADQHKNEVLQKLQKKFQNKKIIKDGDGIIRNESRLQNAQLPYDTKSPMYINPKSDLAKLILRDIHEKNAHCGKEHTLSIARQRFWIPKPSGAFKKFLKNCVNCKKWQGLPFGAPNMPPLPQDRVIVTKPFDKVGCDFMGPITIKNQEKVYVCLYTCLTIRAIHLEVVENMSTGAFLNSFIRFISRRGVPSTIRTDCGTNFRLGQQILDTMFEKDPSTGISVMSYSANCGIKWIFNPPGAPWMGGAWERLIGTVKRAFRKSIGRRRLDLTDLCTAITRIEAIINTRPLTKLDFTDISEIPLRPVDFLQTNIKFDVRETLVEGESNDLDFDPELIQTAQQAKQALLTSTEIADKFWERWNTEYLTALREIQRISLKQPRHVPLRNPVIGEIVLIKQENLPRGNWLYGKIIELVKSLDGQIRSAKMLLPNKHVCHRPLNTIYPLEIQSDVEGTNINNGNLADIDGSGSIVTGDSPDMDADAANPPTGHEDPPQRRPPRQAMINARTIIRNFERSLDESDEPEEGHSRVSTPISQMLFSIITVFCLINPVVSEQLICENGNVKINNLNTTFELCMGSFCRSFSQMYIAQREWSLPPTALNKTMFVSLRYLKDDQEVTEQSYCIRPHICEHSMGILSKKLLANPHCWPNGAIASLGLALYAIIVTTVMLSTCMKRLLSRPVQVTVNTSDNASVQLQLFSPPTLYRTAILALVCILALTDVAAACQNGHIRQEIDLVCTNHNSCSYEYKREILFNKLDVKLCISIMHANKSVGLIEVERYPTIMRCAKRSLYFTRDTTTKVFSTVRCSQAGSCVNDKCSQTTVNTTIKELGKAHRFPGYSGCQHSCGGLGCGCFLPLPACSFYRVTQVPRNEEIYEVISCLKWEPLVQLKVRVSLYNQEKETLITSAPYINHAFEGMLISIISVQSPHFSMLDRKIAISNKEALLLPEGYELAVKCATYQAAAKEFKNCANQMICSCEDANGAIKCHCPQMSIRDVKNDITNVFPIHTPYISMQKRDKELFVKSMQGEVVVSLESRSLKNSAEYLLEQDCKLNASSVVGCYDCQEGAQVNVSCTTNDRAWIVIQCGERTFSVECDSQGKETTLAIEFQNAIVQETCVTQCNKKTIQFSLTGTLNFVPDIVEHILFENPDQLRNSHADWFADWKIPSFLPIWNTLRKHWKVTTSILGLLTVLSVTTYLFGPALILALARVLYSCAVIIVKATKLFIQSVYRCIRADTH